jgi:hypothetical protein
MALQISISNAIGARAVAGGGGIDPDAQAFITAASITDPTQQSAINTLVTDLKGYGIWTKMKAIYPYVGGSATSHSYNLKNPSQFQITWNGGITHSVNGVLFGGVNGYGNTGYNISVNNTGSNISAGAYSRTNAITAGSAFGAVDGGFNGLQLAIKFTDQSTYYGVNDYIVNGAGNYFSDTRGFYVVSRASTTNKVLYRNNVLLNNQGGTSNTAPNLNVYVGARNNPGNSASSFDSRQYAFEYIGDTLDATEIGNLTTAVQSFQVTLGRSIGTQTVSDADAQAFVTNAGIVDQVEANAINNLVIGLKADSLWTKMKAIYPFVGGTSTTMKYNLVNPLDTDAAFRLVFFGGATFSSTGYLPNGTNGYADTKLIAQGTLGLNSTSFGVYSRTNVNRNAPSIGNVTGGASAECSLWLSSGGNAFLRVNNPNVSSQASTDSRGLFVANRANSTQINLQIRGTQYTFSQNSNSLYANSFQLGGVSPNFFDNKELAFSFIGDGLTSQNMTDLDTRVTTFQTALNRNV